MKNNIDCYLRPYRRRWGLTQEELASLVGVRSGGVISRIERGQRSPQLITALSFQVLFGTAFDELFPTTFAHIEDEVIARAYDLYERLQGTPSTANRVKLDFFEKAFERAKKRLQQPEI